MTGLTPKVVLLVICSMAFQLLGLALMPRTKGFTDLRLTIPCAAAFIASPLKVGALVGACMPVGVASKVA